MASVSVGERRVPVSELFFWFRMSHVDGRGTYVRLGGVRPREYFSGTLQSQQALEQYLPRLLAQCSLRSRVR
jgi:hypothetical protein